MSDIIMEHDKLAHIGYNVDYLKLYYSIKDLNDYNELTRDIREKDIYKYKQLCCLVYFSNDNNNFYDSVNKNFKIAHEYDENIKFYLVHNQNINDGNMIHFHNDITDDIENLRCKISIDINDYIPYIIDIKKSVY